MKKYLFFLLLLTGLSKKTGTKMRRPRPSSQQGQVTQIQETKPSQPEHLVVMNETAEFVPATERKKESTQFSQPSLLDIFCAPIIFTDAGFKCYIKHRYNRAEYSDFLSLCFTDMIEFLTWGKQQKSRDYPKRILNLFHSKLKHIRCINAFAFQDLLKEMPELLKHYFVPEIVSKNHYKKNINELLYSSFLNRFDEFKQEPETFLDDLSGNIATILLQETLSNETISPSDLRNQLLRFLEQGLNKLIWSWEEGAEVWQSFKTLDTLIMHFNKEGILTFEEDLDDLYWSLITSFEYFIELAGSQLPLSVYQEMRKDLDEENLNLFIIEEQEDYVETKPKYLRRIINSGAVKAQAHSMGFINEIIAA